MSTVVEAFAAGLNLAAKTLKPKIQRLQRENQDLAEALDHYLNLHDPDAPNPDAQRMTFIMQTTDDNAARIKVQEKDRLGAVITGETLTATLDQPTKASVIQDPNDPTAFIVTRLPLADGDPDVLTVNVTITDTASGMTGTQPIEFDPGKATALTFDTEIAPLPTTSGGSNASTVAATPAVGDTVSLPADPADPSGPTADHTVTAVAADGSIITAQPVAGGDPVTVPTASVTAATN